jgi:hypothetical protein
MASYRLSSDGLKVPNVLGYHRQARILGVTDRCVNIKSGTRRRSRNFVPSYPRPAAPIQPIDVLRSEISEVRLP